MKKLISILLVATLVSALVPTVSARLLGDINSDGTTNSSDALAILQYAVGVSDEINEKYADVNGDGQINSGDALIVLQISVGSYEGDTEIDDEPETSFKKDVVDPIMSSGVYTLVSSMTVDGKETVATTMINGNNLCIETEVENITARVLVLDSKTYLVMPGYLDVPGLKGIYMEYEQQLDVNTGETGASEYVSSEKVTVDGEDLVCETYKLEDGTVSEYYFKDGKWVMLSVTQNGETSTQKIVELKKGVNKSYFSLDGYLKIEA